jgi:hypothetical protein
MDYVNDEPLDLCALNSFELGKKKHRKATDSGGVYA